MQSSNNPSWADYYHKRKNFPPTLPLIKALDYFEIEKTKSYRFAIDLGCGTGHDTLHLLKNHWSVLAIDKEANAFSYIHEKASHEKVPTHQLKTHLSSFETLSKLPRSHLINAYHSLPFLVPDEFYRFWKIIEEALQPEGRFSGTFFGINDSWHQKKNMTMLERNSIQILFRHFKIESLEEIEIDEPNILGNIKHWHIYFVVAKKIWFI